MSGGLDLAIALNRQGHALTVHATPHLIRQKNSLGDMESSFVIGVGPDTSLTPVR